ncbi:MAG: hypothetical protein K2M01_07085 [Paramuribaculum sp.]|nr:hypothetical protein [Paramuribaculum sp.]
MKNKILYLLIICISGCLPMVGKVGYAEIIKPLEASAAVAEDKNTRCDSLPTPQWEEGYATITGKTLNYDPEKDDNHNAQIYPRSSFGRYLDQKHGTVAVDSLGNYKLVVKLYQTHQPCYIDIPGYYGLMYLSPGDSMSVTVDFAGCRAQEHPGNEGSVTFVGGSDFELNNMLATNEVHDVIRNSFGNRNGFNKKYSDNSAFVDAVMAHRAAQYAYVDSLLFTDRMKQVLRLNIDCDAAEALLTAPIYRIVKPDTAYYSFLRNLRVDNKMLRWASDYDRVISYCSNLHLPDNGPKIAQIDADILESLLERGKLNSAETALVEEMLRYNIDRLPEDVLNDRRERFSRRVEWLCDSLRINGAIKETADKLQAMLADENICDARKICNGYLNFISEIEKNYGISMQSYHTELNNDVFGRETSAFFETNNGAIDALFDKYDSDYLLIKQRHDMARNIKRFTDITNIDNNELRQNLVISIYSDILSEGDLIPDDVFDEEIKNFSPVAVSFLTEQNNILRQTLAKAVSNVCQMSPDDDGDKIILNLVEKHRGKMIFIDIWNTWCGACLGAMADHEQEKGDYIDKVAFVYLADETSPETLWNERIKSISGDHYRLPLNQHQSLMQRFNFQGYPSYIIIGTNGDILLTTNHIPSLTELDNWLN